MTCTLLKKKKDNKSYLARNNKSKEYVDQLFLTG